MTIFVVMFCKFTHNKEHHTNAYVLHDMVLHYNVQFKPKLVQGKCTIRRIPFACNKCTYHLDLSWITTLSGDKQPIYHIPKNCV